MPNFTFCGECEPRQRLPFSFPAHRYGLLDSTPEKFVNIRQMKRDGGSAINFEAARIHLVLSDDFVAVVVV